MASKDQVIVTAEPEGKPNDAHELQTVDENGLVFTIDSAYETKRKLGTYQVQIISIGGE